MWSPPELRGCVCIFQPPYGWVGIFTCEMDGLMTYSLHKKETRLTICDLSKKGKYL